MTHRANVAVYLTFIFLDFILFLGVGGEFN